MKLSVYIIWFAIVISFTNLYGQSNPDKKVTIEGKTYLLHQVKKGETMYSLGKKFGIENQVLLNANPELKSGLKTGATIKILIISSSTEEDKKFTTHVVETRQTVFNIAKKYKTTPEDLYKYNPELKNGLTIGQVLRIPIKNTSAKTEEAKPVVSETIPEKKENIDQTKNTKSICFSHRIEPGESLFDLEKRYGVPADTLKTLNPSLSNGINAGTVIQIPTSHIPVVKSVPVNESEFIKHTVVQGETIFSIASSYNVRIRELRTNNPELEYRDILVGETLWVPNKKLITEKFDETTNDTILVSPAYKIIHSYQNLPQSCEPDPNNRSKTYHIGLLLPLYLTTNDTINRAPSGEIMEGDSIYYDANGKEILIGPNGVFKEKMVYQKSENFIHFYEGVLIALDKLQNEGMNIELHVFDTEQSQYLTDKFLQSNIALDLDLIIGPVFPNQQKNISAFSAKNRIPMVSPLSSDGNFETQNPYYFKVNPSREFLIKETAKYITDEFFDKNFVVFEVGNYSNLPEAELVNLCREKLNSTGYYKKAQKSLFHKFDFNEKGYEGLESLVLPDQENVFMIPAYAEGQVSTAFTNLNTLAEKYNVTLVGLSNFKRYQSIQQEYFHRTKLKYLTHYFVDYENVKVNRFIETFKMQFSTEPNEFSFQGYDITCYFLSALRAYGKDLPACISNFNTELTQLNLNFQKVSKAGGFMNCGLFEIGYEKDFSIKNYGKYGPKYLIPARK